jgi:hypothetical protein
MSAEASSAVLSRIYTEWKLEARDRHMIDALGEEGVENLCAMYVALEHAFAHNPELAALWPTTRNRGFNNRSPIEVVREEGIDGLKRVRCFLDLSG